MSCANNETVSFWGYLKRIFFILVFVNLIIALTPQFISHFKDYANPKTKIAWIEVKGMIADANQYINEIRYALGEDSIKGVLLKVNSPGGVPGSSELIYRELLRLSDKKPTIALVENVCASGAYWVALAANKIIAQEASILGSIGIYVPWVGGKRALGHLNLDVEVLSKGDFKTVGCNICEMTDKHRKHLQKHLDDGYDIFVNNVAASRNLNKADHKIWADGKIFNGRQALEERLIDKIGGLHDAEEELRAALKLPEDMELTFVRYPRPSGITKLFKEGQEDLPESCSAFFKPTEIITNVIKNLMQTNALFMYPV